MIVLLIFFSLFSNISIAQEMSPEAKSLNEKLSYIQSLEANFTQTTFNNGSRAIIEGKMYLKKPLHLIWKPNKDSEATLLIKNNLSYIIDNELEQVMVYEDIVSKNILAKLLLHSKIENLDDLKISHVDGAFKITSTNNNSEVLYFYFNENIIDKIIWHTHDNIITTKFSRIKVNQDISMELFKNNFNEDYEIINVSE